MSRGKVTIIREYETNQDKNQNQFHHPSDDFYRPPREDFHSTRITTSNSSRSDEKPMKINVIRENTGKGGGGGGSGREVVPAQKGGKMVVGGEGQPPQSFIEMQAKMEDELERRRLDWEKDVMKMQHDFFKMPGGTMAIEGGQKVVDPGREGDVPVNQTHIPSAYGSEILDISNTKNLYHHKPDGSRVYRLRFNVKDFAPNEISVKAEGKRILVTARHVEEKDSGQKSTKNFNRQMEIPAGVEAERLVAELSSDGILSVEAPVNEAEAERARLVIPGAEGTGNYDQIEMYSVGDPFKAIQGVIPGFTPHYTEDELAGAQGALGYECSHTFHSPTCHHPTRPKMHHSGVLARVTTPHIEDVNDNAKKVKLEVDVGVEYTPDDVTVEWSRDQIHVRAKHEEKTNTGRTAKREYSRSFDIPEKIDPRSLRAVLSNDGYLMVQASLVSNKDTRAAMNSIKRDMATGGIPVNIVV